MVCNQPPLPLTQEQMDFTYSLPYERTYHPKYKYVPAIEEVQFSITSNRGCFGSCAFCAITSHQGRVISSRSVDSVVEEAKKIIAMPSFKGYIHDVGGPSANFSRPACDKQAEHGACAKRQCLWPKPLCEPEGRSYALCGDARCAARLAWREESVHPFRHSL